MKKELHKIVQTSTEQELCELKESIERKLKRMQTKEEKEYELAKSCIIPKQWYKIKFEMTTKYIYSENVLRNSIGLNIDSFQINVDKDSIKSFSGLFAVSKFNINQIEVVRNKEQINILNSFKDYLFKIRKYNDSKSNR